MTSGVEQKLCAAALRLAAKHSWNSLTLEQIVAAAKVSPAQAKKYFTNKDQLLPAIVRQIDARTITKAGKINPRDTAHDRLFQLMMARFDCLQEHRPGILSILEATRRDPSLARLIVPAQIQSMQKLLEQARVTSAGQAQIAAFGLLAVYYRALWCWHKDATRDMAKTMVALDQGLRCAGRLAEILFRDS